MELSRIECVPVDRRYFNSNLRFKFLKEIGYDISSGYGGLVNENEKKEIMRQKGVKDTSYKVKIMVFSSTFLFG